MSEKPRFFKTPADFRTWLDKNHDKLDVQWVGYWKVATGKPSMTWEESVAEALCYGWIDGLRKSIDDEAYKIRFTPRRDGSVWSAKNIATIDRLIKEKRIMPAGLAAWKRRKDDKSAIYSCERAEKLNLSAAYEKQFKKNKAAWAFFQSQAPGYRSKTSHWVMAAKKEETRQRRLAQLMDHCAEEAWIPAMRPARKGRKK